MQYKAFGMALKPMNNSIRNVFRKRSGKPLLVVDEEDAYDPALPHEQVPWWTWLTTLVVAVILTCAIMGRLFGINVGLSILSIVLGFIFSAMGVLGAGYTGACSDASAKARLTPRRHQPRLVGRQGLAARRRWCHP
jgi:hypothetical protein